MNTTILKKRNSWTTIGFLLLVVPFTIALTFYWLFPYILHCYMIDYSDFKAMKKNIYISGSMPSSLHEKIIDITRQAQDRTRSFWGDVKSRPTFIFCSTEEEFQQFGENRGTPAMVHITPLGAFIIAKPDGTNVDVISHEICHAEFAVRIGLYKKRKKIPAWFDEGLALQLDYRYPYPGSNRYKDYLDEWKVLNQGKKLNIELEELENIDAFFQKGEDWTHQAYFRSGMEVTRWLEITKRKGLQELIQQVKKGKPFMEAYQNIESQAQKGMEN